MQSLTALRRIREDETRYVESVDKRNQSPGLIVKTKVYLEYRCMADNFHYPISELYPEFVVKELAEPTLIPVFLLENLSGFALTLFKLINLAPAEALL